MYGVYYRNKNKGDRVFKRKTETYRNANGLLASRDIKYSLEEAEQKVKELEAKGYEAKYKEVR